MWQRRNMLRMCATPILAGVALIASGCIQEYALEPVATVVGGRIETSPPGGRMVGVRVNMVGTSTDQKPVTSDYTFCDTRGKFTLVTQRLGRGFVVARGIEYDMGYDDVYLPEYGSRDSVDRLIPATDSVTLFRKTPGSALFLVFEQDFGPFESVHVVGSFNDFALDETAIALHDDGSLFELDPATPGMQTSGDYAAGDGVWTRRVQLPAGEHQYGFIFNRTGDPQRDPYEEKSSGGRSVIVVK